MCEKCIMVWGRYFLKMKSVFEPIHTTVMKGQIYAFEPPLQKTSHAKAEFSTLKPALSIDMEHAAEKLLDMECFSLF